MAHVPHHRRDGRRLRPPIRNGACQSPFTVPPGSSPATRCTRRPWNIAKELGNLGFADRHRRRSRPDGSGQQGGPPRRRHLGGAQYRTADGTMPNPYASLSITFNHFFARKVMLAKYATAFIAMPGGIGTLDELTEIVCLIQTHKMKPFPVISVRTRLLGRSPRMAPVHDARRRIHLRRGPRPASGLRRSRRRW